MPAKGNKLPIGGHEIIISHPDKVLYRLGKFTKADLNPDTWTVHVEAAQGAVRYVIDGKIENLGSLSRSISGTWIQGNQKGDFKITRH